MSRDQGLGDGDELVLQRLKSESARVRVRATVGVGDPEGGGEGLYVSPGTHRGEGKCL